MILGQEAQLISPASLIVRILNKEYFKEQEDLTSSRSMKKRNKIIFDSLKSIAKESGFKIFHEAICINTDSESKSWLKNCSSDRHSIKSDFDCEVIKNLCSISMFYYEDSKYLIISGIDQIELDQNGFEYIDSNAGMFTLFTSLGLIKLTTPINEIYDKYLFFDEHNEGVRYLDFEDFSLNYEPFHVFILKETGQFNDFNMKRIASYVALESKRELYSKVNNIYEYLFNLIAYCDDSINLSRLPKCIYIKDEPYLLFMELYRMIERLFSIPSIEKLKKALSIEDSCAWNVTKNVENTIGWRKNEKEGLRSLLSNLDDKELELAFDEIKECHSKDFDCETYLIKASTLKAVLEKVEKNEGDIKNIDLLTREKKESLVKCIADYIYLVRNSHVHYREALNAYLSDEELNALSKSLLLLINPIYINVFNK